MEFLKTAVPQRRDLEAAERLQDGSARQEGRNEGTDKREELPPGLQQSGGPVWRERSASVASLWRLAVRRGAAMGRTAPALHGL